MTHHCNHVCKENEWMCQNVSTTSKFQETNCGFLRIGNITQTSRCNILCCITLSTCVRMLLLHMIRRWFIIFNLILPSQVSWYYVTRVAMLTWTSDQGVTSVAVTRFRLISEYQVSIVIVPYLRWGSNQCVSPLLSCHCIIYTRCQYICRDGLW